MLKLLRKKKVAKRIFYVLAAIIIPAFVIWGSASVMNKDKTPNYAGRIFGRKVSFDEYRDALYGWKISMKLQFGEKANEVMNSFFNPQEAAWDRLILLHDAKKRGIKISDKDVINMITNLPFLQKNGQFDSQNYNLFLRYSLAEPAHVFEEKLRQNIAMSKVFEEVTRDIKISDEEVKKEYEKQNTQTRVAYTAFLFSDHKDKVTVNEAEEKAYYEKNKDTLKVPPQINAIYVGIDINENATQEEKEQITERMKKIAAQAKTKGIEKAASAAGMDTKETGLFGLEDPIPALGWIPELANSLFDLPQGELTKLISLKRGIYLFQIKEKKDAYLPEFSQAKTKIKDRLTQEKAKEAAKKAALDLLNNIKTKNITFEKAAELQNAAVKETQMFNMTSYIPEIGMAEPLKEAAFKLKNGETFQEPIELELGFYCIKSIETKGFDEEKFKNEKTEFSNNLLGQKKDKVFSDYFSALKKKAGLVSYLENYQTLPR